MGGFGSGRCGGGPVAESLRSLDINMLNRKSLLEGWYGNLAWWDDNGDQTGSITVGGSMSQVHVTGALNGEPWDQIITLSRTPCNFGGDRPWFICPARCGRRVGKLYIGPSGLACRKCYGLVHASTREDVVGRTWRKKRKLEALLDNEGEKPKGMHWRTYNRIYDQLDALEGNLDQQFYEKAIRMLGW